MSYCKYCGAYIPDWAEDCPSCGKPKAAPKAEPKSAPNRGSGKGAASSGSAARATGGEYHYSYRKAGGTAKEPPRAKARRAPRDKGAFTYGEEDARASGGAFTYDYDEERQRRDTAYYAREYKSDARANRWLAALCYFGPMFLLSWLLKPGSSFVRYHVNQGLVLFLCSVIINIFDFVPFMWVLNIFSVVCVILGVSNALKARRKPLPIIGDITLIK